MRQRITNIKDTSLYQNAVIDFVDYERSYRCCGCQGCVLCSGNRETVIDEFAFNAVISRYHDAFPHAIRANVNRPLRHIERTRRHTVVSLPFQLVDDIPF